jgi:hypothetical protein
MWAQEFRKYGFWDRFLLDSDIPIYTTLFAHLSGFVTHLFYGRIDQYTFPGVLKTLQLPFWIATLFMILSMTDKKKINKISTPLTFMILLNPSTIMNLNILGYMDVFYIFFLFLSIFLIDKMDANKKIVPLLFAASFVIGPFTKPQYIMFMPILFIFGFYKIYKYKLFRQSILGVMLAIFILLITLAIGSNNIKDFIHHGGWMIDIYANRILSQDFVVANFPNFWQIVNAFVHNGLNIFDVNLRYWIDPVLADRGKLLFIVVFIGYSVLFGNAFFNKKSYNIRKVGSTYVLLIASLWTITIYSIFNTTVHENHLVAAVFLSATLYAIRPDRKNIFIFIFFTLFNFVNLIYYYRFGLSGLFGISPDLSWISFNLPVAMSFFYILALLIYSRKFLKGEII